MNDTQVVGEGAKIERGILYRIRLVLRMIWYETLLRCFDWTRWSILIDVFSNRSSIISTLQKVFKILPKVHAEDDGFIIATW